MVESKCDILIVGGGVGGTAAALSAVSHGYSVVLTEQYDWIGGQLTSQAVPPDEHPWIEEFGSTARYREFRRLVRDIYRKKYPIRKDLRNTRFNPGGGFVSGLCADPRIAHDALMSMLSEHIFFQDLVVKAGSIPVSVDVDGDKIVAVHIRDNQSGIVDVIHASIVLDCTELGDLLPLTGAEYVSGAESRFDTGELHAADVSNEDDVQGFTWCFAAGYDVSKTDCIDRPPRYDFWRQYIPNLSDTPWPGHLLDWTAVNPVTLAPRTFDLFGQAGAPYNSLWNYRKIVSGDVLGVAVDDVSLVNWPQNDYFLKNIIDKPTDVVEATLNDSRQLSLSLMYWMQTEAPRPDGGVGYPGLYIAGDVLGTDDGFAMAPYIRESRRIKALFTVTEAHIGAEMRAEMGFSVAETFADTVGVGSYRIDLHPTPGGRNYVDIGSLPFQIPLGSLIPVRVRNLIAANKNIGATHITNGCFRLHPVEWNIGEVAGHLAAYCLAEGAEPRAVREKGDLLSAFQTTLIEAGVELYWPDDIARTIR